ncbi:UPF0182 family protein [Corynebacterium bovis]|uniref:UPF0182 family protein n=1 Tax=Corynebacterium bovis TaxID=36808 RepID=UPI000F648104|nr:UPF0182 family protein [Corynebacterium bovis]RRQ14619.1 membrane protein [Corynebacterium bovis]
MSDTIPAPGRTSKIVGLVAAVVAVLFFVVPVVVSNYTDFLWFGSVDLRGVFTTVLVSRVLLFLLFGVVAGALVWGAAYAAFRVRPDEYSTLGSASPLAEYRPVIRRALRPFLVIVPVVVGVVAGLVGQGSWRTALMAVNAREFGRQDPQFHHDLGFYAFILPALQLVLTTLVTVVVVGFVVNLAAHYLLGSITTGNPRVGEKASVSVAARRQLAVIAGVFMLLKAVDYWFQRYSLLNNEHGTFTGGSYTDINAVLPARILLLIVSVFVAAMFFASIVLRDLRIPGLAVVLMIVAGVVLGIGWPAIMEQFSVGPNRAVKEREYIARNMEATREAYGIGPDKVTYEENWGGGNPGDSAERRSIGDDKATLSNIRLLDPEVVAPTFTQQQQLRNFYGFSDDLAVDRYQVDGQMREFVVAAREINPNNLSGNQTDWINRHTVYTHGNGFIAAPANKVDEVARDVGSARGGFPVYTVADLQNMDGNQGGELKVDMKQPRIYYGPLIGSSRDAREDYAIVGDNGEGRDREYDTDSRNTTYDGRGGVNVSNPVNRLAFAAKYESMNILLSDVIGDNSKILQDRDPRERVHKVAPWLTTDSKTYPVVIDGRIKWIVDGYTTLTDLPYSERTSLNSSTQDAQTADPSAQQRVVDNDVSYIRNSVKGVVDAYDGSVDLYAFDESDPVLQTWQGAFPGVVKPKSEISKDLMDHLRYPEDIFKVQRELMARYHVQDPGVFFTNDAFWSVPSDPTLPDGARELAQPPYQVIAADPETGKPSFQLITPFRGLRREFLAAHMSVSSDPKTYGRIYVRELPTDTQTQGPRQAQDTMMSSDETARERTLLEGSNKLTNGNLLTLPVGDGQILYVEPVYSQRKDQDSAFPKLLRVLVSYNGQVGYAPTITEALSQVGISTDVSTAADDKPSAGGAATNGANGANGGAGKSGNDGAGGANGTNGANDAKSGNDGKDGKDAARSGAAGAATSDADLKAIRDAMDKVNRARTNGSFEEFGRALDELDDAVKKAQGGQR